MLFYILSASGMQLNAQAVGVSVAMPTLRKSNATHTHAVCTHHYSLRACHTCNASVTGDQCNVAAGDTNIQLAHEKRFQERVQQMFTQFKKQRLTSAELECEKLVNSARDKLTEV